MFVKYIDENRVRQAPRKLVTPHLVAFNFNENEELLAQEGYKPLVEKNTREDVEDETHYAKPTYTLKDDCIEVTYTAEEIVEEAE